MRHFIFITAIVCLLVIPAILTVNVNAEADFYILDNKGLTQFSSNNYTLKCKEANSNILTVYVAAIDGTAFLTIAHKVEGIWAQEGLNLLDTKGHYYNIQFTDDGQYRLRATVQFNDTTTYEDYYINVIDGAGAYAGGDISELIEMGEWVKIMMLVNDRTSFEVFKPWAQKAFQWYKNPAYILMDFFSQMLILFLLPHTYVLLALIAFLILLRYRGRIRDIRKEREVAKRYGKREDIILEKRRIEEKLRLKTITKLPIDTALKEHGGDDDVRARAFCYTAGIDEEALQYNTAYSLAVDLGGRLYSEDKDDRVRAQSIIQKLVDRHEPVLEKVDVYRDIATCARAISSLLTSDDSRSIVQDKYKQIAELAEADADDATKEFSRKLQIKSREGFGLSKTIDSIEKDLKAKKDKLKGGTKRGKDSPKSS